MQVLSKEQYVSKIYDIEKVYLISIRNYYKQVTK